LNVPPIEFATGATIVRNNGFAAKEINGRERSLAAIIRALLSSNMEVNAPVETATYPCTFNIYRAKYATCTITSRVTEVIQ